MVSQQHVKEGLARFRQQIADNDPGAEKTGITALHDAVALGGKEFVIDTYIALSGYSYMQKLDLLRSLEYAKLAETYIDTGEASPIQIAQTYKHVATAYFELRQFDLSVKYYNKGIEYILSIPEPSQELLIQLAAFYFNMSNFYLRLSMFHMAKGYAERGHALAQKIGDPKMLLTARMTIANCLHYTKQYAEALPIYLELLAEHSALLNPEMLAVLNNYIGIMYVSLGQDALAEPYLLESLAIRRRGAQRFREAFSYYSLIQLYGRMGRMDQVTSMAAEIQDILAAYPNAFGDQVTNNMLADTYASLGEYRKAYEYKNKIEVASIDAGTVDSTIANIFQTELSKQEKTKEEATRLQKLNLDMQQYAKQLEYSNTDLKSYAHTTSHDLREPLRMISTYMTILETKLQNKLSEDEKKFMHFAVDGAQRMDDMISRILNTAKSQDISLQPIPLARIAERVTANLTKLLSDRNARFTYDPLPTVMGDEILWLQVIQNLVTNAVKYNSSSTPTVHISFIKNTDNITLAISDNGVGIAPENRQKVFEIYSRVENPTGEDGTGIGLSTVKRNIERMQGKIWIESNEPTGSIFKIEVPPI